MSQVISLTTQTETFQSSFLAFSISIALLHEVQKTFRCKEQEGNGTVNLQIKYKNVAKIQMGQDRVQYWILYLYT
jgi:hypothetical protein